MRALEFYEQGREHGTHRLRKQPAQVKASINTPWNSETWVNLTKKFSNYPFCIDSQTCFTFEEIAVWRKIEALRNIHLHQQLPKAVRIPFGINARQIVKYSNPKPYEKICARSSIFGNKLPTEVPEKYSIVIYLFSHADGRPIAHYTEDINCTNN